MAKHCKSLAPVSQLTQTLTGHLSKRTQGKKGCNFKTFTLFLLWKPKRKTCYSVLVTLLHAITINEAFMHQEDANSPQNIVNMICVYSKSSKATQ